LVSGKENGIFGEELAACWRQFRRVFQIHGDSAHMFERVGRKKRKIRKRKL
jgi:hypothetical protein